ncbi:ATPase family AAA domain-containing protein FIGL1 isoform X2 [Telopea speciosissima]|uniref:ATPase family AAA domain-containing protein FIGL1 isoform X2 n=2 Tax=Telopea speciosissima TaxID=54955 RepID=UPI001CC71D1B|nr:ATPase family AAA domain-containing protein FIGL1 isoform X2 [Telopea speciosissima]
MAGTKESEVPSLRVSSSSSSPAREKRMGKNNSAAELCWREEVDQNLKRLHSLLFGADIALERGDFSSAQILGLRLLGFLDSQTRTDVDEAFIDPIRREVASKIDTARRSLAPESDRQAFEQAKRDPGFVFVKKEIDVEMVKHSKYFRAFFQKPKIHCSSGSINSDTLQSCSSGEGHSSLAGRLNRQNDELNCKPSKTMTQAKLTSIYGNKVKENNSSYKCMLNSRSNGSEDCTIVEKAHSFNQNHHKGHGITSFLQAEEEAKPHGGYGIKRAHMETGSPRFESIKSPSSTEEANADVSGNGFVTARAKLEMDARQKRGLAGSPSSSVSPQSDNCSVGRGYGVRSVGFPRRGIRSNFVPPIRSNGANNGNTTSRNSGKGDDALDDSTKRCLEMLCGPDGELPEKLRNLEPRLIEHVSNEIMDRDPNVRWEDIAGLDHAKKCVTEMVIWPLIRPDLFKGCRSPGRGLLLFGPPGTGKTMIGKAIAGEAKATFFYISASSLTSKWIGEGEKLVRALFGVASCRQPAVIFVDEIDSLLSQRKSEGEHESSRRLKTQFLIEMEGFDGGNEQILLIGATNRPQELDEAARRRLTKRLYIPLPSSEARAWIIQNLLDKDGLFKLSKEDIEAICKLTEGYSGSDTKNLVKDASMGPLREALRQGVEITKLKKEDMRPVTLQDFENALQEVRPSVSLNELGIYEEWNRQFGSLSL